MDSERRHPVGLWDTSCAGSRLGTALLSWATIASRKHMRSTPGLHAWWLAGFCGRSKARRVSLRQSGLSAAAQGTPGRSPSLGWTLVSERKGGTEREDEERRRRGYGHLPYGRWIAGGWIGLAYCVL